MVLGFVTGVLESGGVTVCPTEVTAVSSPKVTVGTASRIQTENSSSSKEQKSLNFEHKASCSVLNYKKFTVTYKYLYRYIPP